MFYIQEENNFLETSTAVFKWIL